MRSPACTAISTVVAGSEAALLKTSPSLFRAEMTVPWGGDQPLWRVTIWSVPDAGATNGASGAFAGSAEYGPPEIELGSTATWGGKNGSARNDSSFASGGVVALQVGVSSHTCVIEPVISQLRAAGSIARSLSMRNTSCSPRVICTSMFRESLRAAVDA